MRKERREAMLNNKKILLMQVFMASLLTLALVTVGCISDSAGNGNVDEQLECDYGNSVDDKGSQDSDDPALDDYSNGQQLDLPNDGAPEPADGEDRSDSQDSQDQSGADQSPPPVEDEDRDEPDPPADGGDEPQEIEVELNREVRVLLPGTSLETELYIITTNIDGPTVMVVGGVHGNEPAGFIAASGIMNWSIDRGTLLVIPRANVGGIAAGQRRTPEGYDLNRAYPGNPYGNDAQQIAYAIYTVMVEFSSDWVLDLHESQDFLSEDESRVGQTLISNYKPETLHVCYDVVNRLNPFIEQEQQKFTVIQPPARGSTAHIAGHEHFLNANGVTVETTVKMRMDDRVFQQLMVVNLFLDELGLREKLPYQEMLSQAESLTR